MPNFSHQIIWVTPHPPLDVSGWALWCQDSARATIGWGMWLVDLIKHKGVAPWGGKYIEVFGALGKTTGFFKMTKVTGKPQGSRAVMEHLTLDTQVEKMKTSWKLRTKNVSRWAETTQAPVSCWCSTIRLLPPSLSDTYPLSTHTPPPEAIIPIHLHPHPQTSAILCPSFFFSRWPG